MQQDEAARAPRVPPAAASPTVLIDDAPSLRFGAAAKLVSASMVCPSRCIALKGKIIPVVDTGSREILCDAGPTLPENRTESRSDLGTRGADARRARRPLRLQYRDDPLLRAGPIIAAAPPQRRRGPPF